MMLESSQQELTEEQLARQFIDSRKSEATVLQYLRGLSYILKFDYHDREATETKLGGFVRSAKARPRVVEYDLKNWIISSKENIKGATIRGYASAVKSLLDYCGAVLNWKQIYSVLPHVSKVAKDEATSIEATRKIFKIGDNRLKFLVALFLSSGIRVGAVPGFRVDDLVEIKGLGIGSLRVYRGEPEEYITFVSSECMSLWKEYRAERERCSEIILGSSSLVRNMTSIYEPKAARETTQASLRGLFGDMWIKAGYHERNFKQIHGWRKAFKTRLEDTGMKSVFIEMLMGHATNYDRPSLESFAKLYAEHQGVLFIQEEYELKSEIKKKDEIITDREMKLYVQGQQLKDQLQRQNRMISLLARLNRLKKMLETEKDPVKLAEMAKEEEAALAEVEALGP